MVLTITDNEGVQSTDTIMVVVYDPSLTGKAGFRFISKYKKGVDVPTGETEFQFKVVDLNFYSSSYEWLVIARKKVR